MRVTNLLLAVFLVALAFASPVGCSDASSSAPDSGTGSSSGGGGPGGIYTPAGCSYTYTPPSTITAYQNLALDDDGAVSATTGQPQRVRIGLGGGTTKGVKGYADPTTTAAFTWETAQQNNAAKLKIGTSAASMTQVQTGYSWTQPAQIGSSSTYFHEVHICGLTPGTSYFYQVGGGASGSAVWSATQTFTTLPATGTITLGTFGDARDTVGTWQAVNQRMRDPMEGVMASLVDGDVVDVGAEETLYTQWLDAIWQPNGAGQFLALGQMLILPINGNHENDTSTSFSNWALPGIAGDPYEETHASFDIGNTHFLMLDDEQLANSLSEGGASAEAKAQLAWVESDLAAASADRAKHPFIVAMNHRGIFSTSLHATDPDVVALRGALAPVFDKYSVDLVINGHDHEYERTYPITANTTTPTGAPTVQSAGKGTTYVICAGSGADPYAVGTTTVAYRAAKTAFGTGTPYIGVYSILTLSGSMLKLTGYGLKASSTTVAGDDVIDTLTLTH